MSDKITVYTDGSALNNGRPRFWVRLGLQADV